MEKATDAISNWLVSNVEYAEERRGLAGDLVVCCVHIFLALLKCPTKDALDVEDYDQIRIQARRYSL